MKTKDIIAIIGATDYVGSLIAENLSKHNYRLILMSRDTNKLIVLIDKLSIAGTTAIINTNDSVRDVSWEADIIIMCCPFEAQREIAQEIREVVTGKFIFCLSPLNSELNTSSDDLQKLLPYSKVIRVTVNADLTSTVIDGKSGSFSAWNNERTSEVVSTIIAAAGLNSVVTMQSQS